MLHIMRSMPYTLINFTKEDPVLKITDIRIRKITAEGKLKAVASVTFDEVFVVHDIKVIDGLNGLFVAMPSRKSPDGEFRDVAHPISTEFREMLTEQVFAAYRAAEGPAAEA